MRKLILFSAFFYLPFILKSQTLRQLDTISVSAVNAPLKLNETGRNIFVLRQKDLQQLPYTSLDDLLLNVPGIELQSRSAFGAQSDILLRGSTFTQVLVLIDGLKMNDPLTGHFNGYIPVTPAEIERVEVMKGPAASIYGPDAVGGVINIITKTFSNKKEEDKKEIVGQLNYGQNQLTNTQQGIYFKKDKLSVSAGFNLNKSIGEQIPEEVIDTNTTLSEYRTFFDIKTVSAAFKYKLKDGLLLKGRTAYDHRDFNARYFYTTSPFDKSTEITQTWWNHLQLASITDKSSSDFNVAYKFNTDEFIFNPDFPSTNNHKTRFLNFTFNHLRPIGRNFTLRAGWQADRRSIESNDRGNHEDWHFGVYAMAVYRPIAGMNINGGVRLDYDENYETEISPQINISYALPSIVLRAAVGRSIRAADYTERYVSNNLQNLTPGRSLGNPDLAAERSWSEEIGFDYFINNNWKIKATAFIRQSDNLIDYVNTNESEISGVGNLQENENYFFAKNISSVNTRGFEIENQLNKSISENIYLQLNIGYTYLETSNDEDIISVYISSHARHLINSSFILNANRFNFSINGIYKNRNVQQAETINSALEESYAVFSSRVGYFLTENFGINMQLHNMLDKKYQNILGARMPGRWFMGGIKWQW
ncbi:MAG: TonB-dependent receptor [Bacteroidota bacterium]